MEEILQLIERTRNQRIFYESLQEDTEDEELDLELVIMHLKVAEIHLDIATRKLFDRLSTPSGCSALSSDTIKHYKKVILGAE